MLYVESRAPKIGRRLEVTARLRQSVLVLLSRRSLGRQFIRDDRPRAKFWYFLNAHIHALQRASCVAESECEAVCHADRPRGLTHAAPARQGPRNFLLSKGELAMGTAFRDLELRLTEAALAAELMPPEEVARLFAEAATVIQDLRSEIEELRSIEHRMAEHLEGPPTARPHQ